MTRSVLITGASSGIGESTARRLARRGWRVFGTSRRPQETDDDHGIRWVVMDVRDEASVAKAVSQVLGESGGIDAVVCNAGMGIYGAVEEVEIEAARGQFETNFFGVLRVLRATLPGMRASASGRVILVGSLAGRAPIPFQAHYSASKAAVDALAGALGNELAAFGIRVCLVEPGDVNTPFNDAMEWTTSPPNSAYGEAIARTEATIRELLPKAPPAENVARCIERALDAKAPRARYTVGDSAWLVPLARRLLPDRISQALIRKHFGL
ncbi:MAG: SDR family NAD(P)-dependent oxidoreductase [Myxococcota bacterium]|nr:SDR family NAD(P)-dependent oxidoreductase [Myxococcota bacterium]